MLGCVLQHQVIGEESLVVADVFENLNAFEHQVLFLFRESVNLVALYNSFRLEGVHLAAEVAFLLMKAHVFLVGELSEVFFLWDEAQLENFLYGLTATEK